MDALDQDAALMLEVARGDERAFAQLFDRHQRTVANFAFRFVGERAKAEELTQEIFVKLFRSASGYRPTARFKTYLFRVAANHCLNELRRGEYRMETSALEAAEGEEAALHSAGSESPDSVVAARELERAVGEALRSLQPRERAAFSMCRFEGLSYKEIAEALSASEAAVKSLIHRATLAVARQVEAMQAGRTPERSPA